MVRRWCETVVGKRGAGVRKLYVNGEHDEGYDICAVVLLLLLPLISRYLHIHNINLCMLTLCIVPIAERRRKFGRNYKFYKSNLCWRENYKIKF